MRVCLLAVVALTAVALCSAADPECIYRRIRGLVMHWPNPTDCSRFYRCTNKGVQREINCDAGKEYNWKTGKCAKSGRSQCPLSLQAPQTHAENICATAVSGAFMAQNGTCRDFYICNEGQAYPQVCNPGSYFDDTMANCQPDLNTTCWQNKCLNKTDGTSVADETSCQSFYICAGQVATRQSCGAGSYYNTTDNNCQPDADGQACIENLCVTKNNGTLVADQSDCHAYYVCANGTATAQRCPEGSYFNWTTKNCTQGECPTSEEDCTCPGGYGKGQMVAHPSNCILYYLCEDSQLKLGNCSAGNYFDADMGACTRDNTGKCPASATRSKRSADDRTDAETKQDVEVHGGVADITEIHIDTARQENQLEKHDDQESEQHNSLMQLGPNNCFGVYSSGQLIIHPVSCNKFLLCHDGELSEGECGIGNYFDRSTFTCEPDKEGLCAVERAVLEPLLAPIAGASTQTASNCTCPGGYAQDERQPHPIDCDKYYVCENGQLQLRQCAEGNRYDNCTKACVADTDHTCWPCGEDACKTHANGILIPNPLVCSEYYMCQNGVGMLQSCAPDQWFNSEIGRCDVDLAGACRNPCANTTGIAFLPHYNCTQYYMCNNGVAHVETCPTGGYDSETCRCTENANCPASMCQTQPNGFTFPAQVPTEFYFCLNKEAILRSCPLDTSYNINQKICLPQPTPDCNQTMCASGNQDNPFSTLNGTANAFCFCRGNIAYEDFCAEGYLFSEARRICYSNAPCDPDLCIDTPVYTITPNRNDTHSFCLCVMAVNIIVDCPNNGTFHPTAGANGLCQPTAIQDSNCNATFCLTKPDYEPFGALQGDAGFCICMSTMGVYHLCPDDTTFDKILNVCMSPNDQLACNPENCADSSVTYFPAVGDDNAFCYCQDTNTVIEITCPNAEKFSAAIGICMPDYCGSSQCANPSNENMVFPATNNRDAFCICRNLVATFIPCEEGYVFDPVHLVCVPANQMECDITRCAGAINGDQYTIPVIGDPTAFCYCASPTCAQKYSCPDNTIYNTAVNFCTTASGNPTNPGGDNCTCPGGYKNGQMVAHPTDCQKYYLCANSTLHLGDCTAGQYFSKSTGVCALDATGECAAVAATQCVGGYRQGDLIVHPGNPQLYFVCYNAHLTVGDCGPTRHFDVRLAACVNSYAKSRPNTAQRRQRSAEVFMHDQQEQAEPQQHDRPHRPPVCQNNAKRSVPSNCTQFELCTSQTWSRRTCPALRYYNPEQQKCLEPLDDAVCAGARVSGLPPCNGANEQRTLPSKAASGSCAQYYLCAHNKWRLRTCPKPALYARSLHACIVGSPDEICTPRNTTATSTAQPCQHMTVRHDGANCAMYLMCLDGEWWHQYCPLGMYFNRTHNYCMPNTDAAQCIDDARSSAASVNASAHTPELAGRNCSADGATRPSALACDKYYVCVRGMWQQWTCPATHYFNVTAEACLLDDGGGLCAQLAVASCGEGVRRAYPFNCTAYEQCRQGAWQRDICPSGQAFDDALRECVSNADGACASSGLRRACRSGAARSLPVGGNCAQFYYCAGDRWQIGNCLSGHTIAAADNGGVACVPHSATDKCRAQLQLPATATATAMASSSENACGRRDDGDAVPHPHDCSRFFLCVHGGAVSSEQQCVRGSFFDAALGYCRPNDGSCVLPLAGACANATDGALLPHADDCRAYWRCSTVDGTQLERCADGEYYHNDTRQCRVDNGECQPLAAPGRCDGAQLGDRIPHERYCNIYYVCVLGLAVPFECPNGHLFSVPLGRCVDDAERQCIDGMLADGGNENATHSCGSHADGVYLPHRADCTRYYICSAGVALSKRCATGAFFDANELLCVPDNGSCPFVDKDLSNHQPVPPDPIVCEGKHGALMPDPANCNEFYVCINGKLRHERCYPQHFFNVTLNQCQLRPQSGPGDTGIIDQLLPTSTTAPQTTSATRAMRTATTAAAATMTMTMTTSSVNVTKTSILSSTSTSTLSQCTDSPTSFADLCLAASVGASLAEQGDCRRYISCEEAEAEAAAEPVSQRCRNGESFDSLLGFCRQNDGTCQLEDGQRVGVCNGRHGQLARDADNCRGYFVCINGQKIAAACATNEYFNRMLSTCQKDTTQQCGTAAAAAAAAATTVKPDEASADVVVSCTGLSEAVLYPYVRDHCRSYFQCVKGVAKVHECADGLYFDALNARCMREIIECLMPTATSMQRAPDAIQTTSSNTTATLTNQTDFLCELGRAYANPAGDCHSYYVCLTNGTIAYSDCAAGTLFSSERGHCAPAAEVICHLATV